MRGGGVGAFGRGPRGRPRRRGVAAAPQTGGGMLLSIFEVDVDVEEEDDAMCRLATQWTTLSSVESS